MPPRSPISRLSLLRQSRALPRGPASLADTVRKATAEIRTLAARATSAESAWSAVVPPAIAALVSSVERASPRPGRAGLGGGGGGGGVLKIRPKGPAARFALDRWLRSGGEAALRAADPKITAVRLVR